jgi:hypothetical protein
VGGGSTQNIIHLILTIPVRVHPWLTLPR